MDRNQLNCSENILKVKSGDLKSAIGLFNSIQVKTNPLYRTLFKGLISMKKSKEVLNLYEQNKMKLDEGVFAIVSKACSEICDDRARRIGKQLLDNLPSSLRCSDSVMNSMIFMLMRFGNVDEAEQLVHQMKHKSIYTYGAMMKGYNDNKMFAKTLDLFETLPLVADEAIYAMVLSSCSHLTNDRARRIGKQLIDNLPEDLKGSENVMNSMIFMLMKFGNIDEAEQLFRQMKHKSIYTYGAMMKGYNHNQMFEKALDLFLQMDLPPNENILTIIFNTCTHLSNDPALQTGKELLRKMNKSYYNNDIVITSAIHMLMKFDLVNDAERLFRQLAIAFNFIQQPPPSIIQISKNLRICGDCHAATKLITKLRRCEIIIRDANRIHHFSNGEYSCQDHF
ncbi:unnamed protein product [Adineta ricciae]|uniref:DYW domain-containing protein n=1 Tax=Adineta ricciae TaxID=249248 RepID=A0A814VWV8_ADIRI|nr:unnamed protein product [Adineta ricciae]